MNATLHTWLRSFSLEPLLHDHALAVLEALPENVRTDLMHDPSFVLCDYEPAFAHSIPVAAPSLGRPSRSVALKRTLRHRPPTFVRYIIAHELAHAFLRNEGRHPGEDPELAADALAAAWGFRR